MCGGGEGGGYFRQKEQHLQKSGGLKEGPEPLWLNIGCRESEERSLKSGSGAILGGLDFASVPWEATGGFEPDSDIIRVILLKAHAGSCVPSTYPKICPPQRLPHNTHPGLHCSWPILSVQNKC